MYKVKQHKKIYSVLLSTLILLGAGFGTKTKVEALSDSSPSQITDKDFLHTDGNIIKNVNGEAVDLRGTNLGGWLHLEGWMDGGGYTYFFNTKAEQQNWTFYVNDQQDNNAKLKMIDRDSNTTWSDSGKSNSKINIYLGKLTTFSSVFLDCKGTTKNNYAGNIKLSYFNGTGWVDLKTVESNWDRTYFGDFGEITSDWISVERIGGTGVWSISELNVARYTMMNDYNVRTALNDKFTTAETDDLLNIYQNAYITETDLDYIASLGLNYVRVPVYWMELMNENGQMKYGAFDQLDWIVEACASRGIYVIIDLHGTPGGHSGGFSTGGQTGANEFWTNTTYQNWVVTIWQSIAERYKNNPSVAGYELLNEPAQFTQPGNIITDVYDRLYNAIREIDSNHIIVLCALYDKHYDSLFGTDVQNFNDIQRIGSPSSHGWLNVVFDTHHYLPEKTDTLSQVAFVKQQIQHIKYWSNEYNTPVMVGECNFYGVYDAWETLLVELNNNHISWSTWAYKNISYDWTNTFAIFYGYTGQQVCFQDDSYDQIAAKFAKYTTSHYSNQWTFADIISKYAQKYEIPNGGFENGLILGWEYQASSLVIDNQVSASGSYSVKMNDSWTDRNKLTAEIKPNTNYIISFKARREKNSLVNFRTTIVTGSDKTLYVTNPDKYGEFAGENDITGEFVTLKYAVRSDTDRIKICLSSGTGNIWLDDFQLEEVTVSCDVNLDGAVNIKDLIRQKKYAVESGFQNNYVAGDINNDGVIGSDDMVLLHRKLLGD